MKLLTALYSGSSTLRTFQVAQITDDAAAQAHPPADLYKILRAYYLNNALYDEVQRLLKTSGIANPAMRGLRNPASEVVEFHAAKTFTADAKIIVDGDTGKPKIKPAIETVWKWSNWLARQRVAARWQSMYGDLFLKVVGRPTEGQKQGRVYFQLTDPIHVTDFKTDERDFITYIRTDIPQVERTGRTARPYVITEVWDKDAGTMRRWEHTKPLNEAADLEILEKPSFEADMETFGIDFVPYVHSKFADIGEDRGIGAYLKALDLIDEANQIATRLHQMLFRHNKVLWALSARMTDPSGRPLAAPLIDGTTETEEGTTILTLGDDQLINLPGMSTLESLVPNINYDSALAVLNAQRDAIMEKCPELAYYQLRTLGGDVSGRAVRLMLSHAIDRGQEARSNGEQALVRANQMALTIGNFLGLEGFTDIGTFENGDFEHTFNERPIIPISELEEWEGKQAKANTLTVWKSLGVPKSRVLGEDGLGYSESEVVEMEGEAEEESAAAMERQLDIFARSGSGAAGGARGNDRQNGGGNPLNNPATNGSAT